MGNHHVQLNIGDDGLIKSVGPQNNENLYETCIMCGAKTDVLISTHIDHRYGYVEGAGQCCRECFNRPAVREDDYIARTMRNRTTLITISAEDILNTPNDLELGAKVRQIYWYSQEPEIVNKWVCSYCGGDTSFIDNDYLVNTDHLECVLKMNP